MSQEEALKRIVTEYPEYTTQAMQDIKDGVDLVEVSVASGFVLSEQAQNAIQSRGVEAVFKNNALNKTSHALDGVMPQALALGGVKLDCYGEKLANTYERSGFITHYSLKNPVFNE